MSVRMILRLLWLPLAIVATVMSWRAVPWPQIRPLPPIMAGLFKDACIPLAIYPGDHPRCTARQWLSCPKVIGWYSGLVAVAKVRLMRQFGKAVIAMATMVCAASDCPA